jgi:hypothetical protein
MDGSISQKYLLKFDLDNLRDFPYFPATASCLFYPDGNWPSPGRSIRAILPKGERPWTPETGDRKRIPLNPHLNRKESIGEPSSKDWSPRER